MFDWLSGDIENKSDRTGSQKQIIRKLIIKHFSWFWEENQYTDQFNGVDKVFLYIRNLNFKRRDNCAYFSFKM